MYIKCMLPNYIMAHGFRQPLNKKCLIFSQNSHFPLKNCLDVFFFMVFYRSQLNFKISFMTQQAKINTLPVKNNKKSVSRGNHIFTFLNLDISHHHHVTSPVHCIGPSVLLSGTHWDGLHRHSTQKNYFVYISVL